MIRLPVDPIVQAAHARGFAANTLGRNTARNWHRAIKRGWISDRFADDICIRHLDIQPELLWPDELRA